MMVNSTACDDGKTKASSSFFDRVSALVKDTSFRKELVAEAIGTGMIVGGGCGVVCAAKYTGAPITPFGIAAIWGASVALAVYCTRDTSGAHLNPAITANMVINNAFPAEKGALFALSQVAGGFIASGANYAMFSKAIATFEKSEGLVRGTPASAASFNGAFGMLPNAAVIGPVGAVVAEVGFTATLAFIISALGDPDRTVPEGATPALVGTTVAVLVAAFAPVSSCGMNPARDLGPRLVTAVTGWGGAAWTSAWIFTVGPLAGAVLGGALYNKYFKGCKDED